MRVPFPLGLPINVRLNIFLLHAIVGHGDARGHYRSPESAL